MLWQPAMPPFEKLKKRTIRQPFAVTVDTVRLIRRFPVGKGGKPLKKQKILTMILSVILPPVAVLIFFIVEIGVIILPATEDALMQRKQELIQSIVISATSIIERHSQMEQEGLVSREEAQQTALSEMRALRYGVGSMDYLWITDLDVNMVMHPYFSELEGTKLDDYADPNGKLIFVEAAAVAKARGDGYIDYMWPKQDDLEEAMPKLSYIRLFEPWGWVVGSGVYLDDVHTEIGAVTDRLFKSSALIGVLIAGLLLFDIRQGWKSEKGRRQAQTNLIRSRERYQALAHASREIVFLTIAGKIAGANKMACETLGIDENEIISHDFAEFIECASDLKAVAAEGNDENKEAIETMLLCKSGSERVLLSADHVIVNDQPAVMYAGYSLKLKENPDNSVSLHDSLSKIGFGMIKLESSLSDKVISADRIATDFFSGVEGGSIVGKPFRSLIHEGDCDRLLLQLERTGKVNNMLLRYLSKRYGTGYLQVSATIVEEVGDASGSITLFLTEVTAQQSVHQVADGLLFELLSPQNKIVPDRSLLDTSPSEDSFHNLYVRTQVLLRQSVKMGLAPEKVCDAMANTITSIYRTAAEEAIASLGTPPCEYALLAIGSVGREEPTLNADQDTALIFRSNKNEAANADYFQRFGALVTSLCADAGIPPCHAGNVAANPKWCMSETAWKRQFSSWIHKSEPENLLLVNIFFDFSVVSGSESLVSDLRGHVFAEVEKRSVFLHNLAQNTLEFRSPSNILGQIRSDSRTGNYVDLKGTMLHFVNFARIYALKNSISETNTIKRLQALMEGRHIGLDTGEETIDAWKFLMELRLKNQVSALEINFRHENTLMLEELSSWEETMLKKAMAQVNNLQKRISSDIVRTG